MGIVSRQSIQGTIATYLGAAIGFVTNFFIITKYLSTEQIGLLTNIILNTAIMVAGLSQMGITGSAVRFFPYFKNKVNKNNGIFFWTVLIPLIGFFIVSVIFLSCQNEIVSVFGKNAPLFTTYYKAILPLAFFVMYLGVFETNATVLQKSVFPRAVREIFIRILMLSFYVLFACHVLTFDNLVVCQCLTYASAALLNLLYLIFLKQISLKPNFHFITENSYIIKPFLSYSSILLITTIVVSFTPTLTSIFISAKVGEHTTGIYTIALLMANLISMPNRSLNLVITPQITHNLKDNDWVSLSTTIQKSIQNLLIISGMVFLALWINIDVVYSILPNGNAFSQAKSAFFVLGFAHIILSTLTITTPILNYSKFYIFSLPLALILIASTIVTSNWLIGKYDMFGAALTTLISYGLYYSLNVFILLVFTPVALFNKEMVKPIFLLGFVVFLNFLLTYVIGNSNLWVSAICRSSLLLVPYCLIVYKFKFSEDINRVISQTLSKFTKYPHNR